MRAVTRVNDIVGVDQQSAYTRALVWIGNTHDRATINVTSRDEGAATIVGTGEMQCNASVGAGLRGMGLGRNQNYLRFVLTFQAKDGRFRIEFAELFYYLRDLQFPDSSLAQGPATPAEVDALYRECLAPLEANLVRALAAPAGADF